jgi:1,4-alpha-glucan branching enzyme
MAMTRKRKLDSNKVIRPGCTRLELTSTVAREVCVAGSFNDWQPTSTPLIGLGDGRWLKELALPPGRYEYRLVVDGQWTDDPSAKEFVPNPLGGRNAVIVVPEGIQMTGPIELKK